MEKLICGWIDELAFERRYSQHTVTNYRRDLFDLITFFEQHFGQKVSLEILQKAKPVDFRAWLSHRIGRGLQARSNVRALSSIKSFFQYLGRRGLIELRSLNAVRHPKLAELLPKPIEEETILRFLQLDHYTNNEPSWVSARDRALYTLLYCTGLRISEALSLTLQDIQSEMKIRGKGKKERIVLLLPIAITRINEYVELCPYDLQSGKLFRGVRGKTLSASLVDIRLKEAQILYDLPDHTSAHAFRHSFASHMIKEGADLRSVQDLLGHESLSSTQIYTKIDDATLFKVYETAHPLEHMEK